MKMPFKANALPMSCNVTGYLMSCSGPRRITRSVCRDFDTVENSYYSVRYETAPFETWSHSINLLEKHSQ